MVAAAIIVKGYGDVGDGFSAGVIVALAVALRYVTLGAERAERTLPVLRHAPAVAVCRAAVRARDRLLPDPPRRAAVHALSQVRRTGRPRRHAGADHGGGVRRRRLPARRRLAGRAHPPAHAAGRGAAAVNLVFALAAAVLFGTGAVPAARPRPRARRLRCRTDLAGRGADARRLGPQPRRGADLPAERGLHQPTRSVRRWR